MEKRFVLFLCLAVTILVGWKLLVDRLMPQPIAEAPQGEVAEDQPGKEPKPDDGQPGAPSAPDKSSAPPTDTPAPPDQPDKGKEPAALASPPAEPRWVSLGSMAMENRFRLVATFNSRGAALERVELVERAPDGSFRFRNLDESGGYLGHLALTEATDGCRVNVVPHGTPANLAISSQTNVGPGLLAGDVIKKLDGRIVFNASELEELLAKAKPKQTVVLTVLRDAEGKTTPLDFTATLTDRPFEIIRPELTQSLDPLDQHPLSCLLTLDHLGGKSIEHGKSEITGLKSLYDSVWETDVSEERNEVAFRLRLDSRTLEPLGLAGDWEIVKRFQLPLATDATNRNFPAYHLGLEIEIINHGAAEGTVAYRLDGPNGLPLEGWWYSNKVHPAWFSAAGARDVIWKLAGQRQNMRGCAEIVADAQKTPKSPAKSLLTNNPTKPQRSFDYLGVDTQYFAGVLAGGTLAERGPHVARAAVTLPLGDLESQKKRSPKTVNVTFRLNSEPALVAPGKSVRDSFTLFVGPKSPALLKEYGLHEVIYYGWDSFKVVAVALSQVLHFLHRVVGNYGIAIIMLTVLVRGCMFPISRQAAQNSVKMQELAPELKKIKEKYKNDMQKQSEAQRELFAKNNFKPMGGCLLVFLQMPIFIGLYRCVSVDVELRQAPLIRGLQWCENLAGPDMLFRWDGFIGTYFAGENSMLGPYFNVLPIITIALFMIQQKMFMPPPTDEQQAQQQQMMQYMMIFMGVMFFKVPSGLCVYFIASSIWGLVERRFMPKPKLPADTNESKSSIPAYSPRPDRPRKRKR